MDNQLALIRFPSGSEFLVGGRAWPVSDLEAMAASGDLESFRVLPALDGEVMIDWSDPS